ncbi:armadillo-type protein [Pilobolus umbonatus]|nr:armadillo-type protein [Pilobolus umbonatus]
MAADTIQKVSADYSVDLINTKDNHTYVLDTILPKLVHLITHIYPQIRESAVLTLGRYIKLRPLSLQDNINPYLRSLFSIMSNSHVEVQKELCHSFVLLLEYFPQNTSPYFNHIMEYILYCHQSNQESLVLEACDFWSQLIHLRPYRDHLRPYLPRVIPLIVKCLVYTEEDLFIFGEDEHEQHKDTLIGSDNNNYEEEDLDDEEFYSEWSLRKLSATCLEAFISLFKSEATHLLLPLLETKFISNDWRVLESAILALSAAAEGGLDDIEPHLPRFIPFLVTHLSNTSVHIRYIACWTLSRFCKWIVSQSMVPQETHKLYYEPVVRTLLTRILDKNRRVQESACSAFILLEEYSSRQQLVPYLLTILEHTTNALHVNGKKCIPLLYETIGLLAEKVGPALNDPKCLDVLMMALMSKWNQLQYNQHQLLPLLTCLADIATSLGLGFLPFTESVFQKSIKLVSTTLQSTLNRVYQADKDINDGFIAVPLDLLSGVVQGLGDTATPFVQQYALCKLLTMCIYYDSRWEILQPSYALIGHISAACFDTLEPYLDTILSRIAKHITIDDLPFKSVRNNAIWAIGEIAIRWRKERMERHVPVLIGTLIPLLHHKDLQVNVFHTLGRLGVITDEKTSTYLPYFAVKWVHLSTIMKENNEKDSSFYGFCRLLKLHPQVLQEKVIEVLFDVITLWSHPSLELQLSFQEVIRCYHRLLTPQQWNHVSTHLC